MFGLHGLPPGRRAAAVAMLGVMAVGSIAMWLVVPVGWIWVASQLQHGSQPGLGPYVLVLFAVPTTMVVIAKGLGALDRAYARYTHSETTTRVRPPWLRSMRGDRDEHAPPSVLSVMMVGSVSLAVLCLLVWFFGFAGSSLPR